MTHYLRVPVNATLLDPFSDPVGTLHLLPGHPLEPNPRIYRHDAEKFTAAWLSGWDEWDAKLRG